MSDARVDFTLIARDVGLTRAFRRITDDAKRLGKRHRHTKHQPRPLAIDGHAYHARQKRRGKRCRGGYTGRSCRTCRMAHYREFNARTKAARDAKRAAAQLTTRGNK